MPHGEGKIFIDNKIVISGHFRYGKLINREGSQKEKSEKINSNIKIDLMEKFEENESGIKLSSKETDTEKKKGNYKIKENEKNNMKNINKNIKPLKNKNKVSNPMDYKFGFLEKVKKNKK